MLYRPFCTSGRVRGTGGGTVEDPGGRVDIPGLAVAGSTVEQASTSLKRAYSVHADGLAASGTPAGWAGLAALTDAADRWAAFVQGLAAEVNALGAGLSASARAYQRTDDAAADRITAATGTGFGIPAATGTGGGIPAGHPAWAHRPR